MTTRNAKKPATGAATAAAPAAAPRRMGSAAISDAAAAAATAAPRPALPPREVAATRPPMPAETSMEACSNWVRGDCLTGSQCAYYHDPANAAAMERMRQRTTGGRAPGDAGARRSHAATVAGKSGTTGPARGNGDDDDEDEDYEDEEEEEDDDEDEDDDDDNPAPAAAAAAAAAAVAASAPAAAARAPTATFNARSPEVEAALRAVWMDPDACERVIREFGGSQDDQVRPVSLRVPRRMADARTSRADQGTEERTETRAARRPVRQVCGQQTLCAREGRRAPKQDTAQVSQGRGRAGRRWRSGLH